MGSCTTDPKAHADRGIATSLQAKAIFHSGEAHLHLIRSPWKALEGRNSAEGGLMLDRKGRAHDKYMYIQTLLGELTQDSNKAVSASSSPVIQRGAMLRKQGFATTEITSAVQESCVSSSPSHTEIIIPLPLIQGRTMLLAYLIFHFPRKRSWLLGWLAICYMHETATRQGLPKKNKFSSHRNHRKTHTYL